MPIPNVEELDNGVLLSTLNASLSSICRTESKALPYIIVESNIKIFRED